MLRSIVGAMGLTGDKVHQDAGTLSGGEKTKLALGILVAGRHNLLLLDEPTNNLDPGSREAVAEGLRGWPGSIVLVSHDAEFVRDLEPNKVLLDARGHPRPLDRRLPRARRAGVADRCTGVLTRSKKSLPLSSTTMKAGKSSTSILQTASMPSSGYSSTSTLRMQSWARRAAGPPIDPR